VIVGEVICPAIVTAMAITHQDYFRRVIKGNLRSCLIDVCETVVCGHFGPHAKGFILMIIHDGHHTFK
jgi:hypothetical protein